MNSLTNTTTIRYLNMPKSQDDTFLNSLLHSLHHPVQFYFIHYSFQISFYIIISHFFILPVLFSILLQVSAILSFALTTSYQNHFLFSFTLRFILLPNHISIYFLTLIYVSLILFQPLLPIHPSIQLLFSLLQL